MVVLVLYASRAGSTKGIADRIAARLRMHRIVPEVHALPSVTRPDAYSAVILGSSVYAGAWLPEAMTYVRQHANALSDRPLWTFSAGWLTRQRGLLRRVNWPDSDSLEQVARWTHPHGHRFFAGSVRRDALPLTQRAAFRLAGGRYGDFRDFHEVDRWVDEIAARLATTADPARQAS